MISIEKDFDASPTFLDKSELKGRNSVILQKLRDIYHDKCSYCESRIDNPSAQVHHYRPKSIYLWLEAEWSNLHLVCNDCNHSIGKKFPIRGTKIEEAPESRPEWIVNSKTLLSEKPLLLNPEVDTPENHLYFDSNGILYSSTERGKITIKTRNLNRDVLVKARRKKVEYFRKEFEKILKNYFLQKEKVKGRFQGKKLIHQILFKDVFILLMGAGKPEAEFALMGLAILENLEEFILDHLSSLKILKKKEQERKDFFLFLQEAKVLFSMSEDRIKLKHTEKKVPLFPKDPSKDVRMKKGLPYAIKSFEIIKYHGLKKVRLEHIPINTRWVFLTGENGFGKTLLLQALVLGLNGKEDKELELADDNCRIKIEMKAHEQNKFCVTGGSNPTPIKNFAAYGSNRLDIDGDVFPGKQASEKIRKTDSLFHNQGALFNIQEYMIQLHGRKKFEKKLNEIIAILKELLPMVEEIRIDDRFEKKKVFYCEKAENGDLFNEVSFGALSTGAKSIIAMIGDMLIEFFTTQEVDNPEDFSGIVFIDELDTHLHVKWQKDFVSKLTELFPKIQFIASTHSPIPLLGAPLESIILNVERPSKKQGITLKRLDIDVKKLTPNTILSSPIFDFDQIISQAHDRSEPLYTQDHYQEVIKV